MALEVKDIYTATCEKNMNIISGGINENDKPNNFSPIYQAKKSPKFCH